MFTSAQTFYNQSIRKTVIAFGSIFESVYVTRNDENGDEKEKIRVPLEYGNKEKFIQTQRKDTSGRIQITLPRMGFEMTNFLYDPSRKLNRLNQRSAVVDGIYKKSFSEVPYNIGFGLYVFTRHMDDMLQIIEQILPYFAPEYTAVIKMNDLHETVNIPFVLNSVTLNEDYEGLMDTRRTLISVFDFTAKTYVYSKICGETGGVIYTTDIDIYDDKVDSDVYYGDVGFTGDIITGSTTQITGDYTRP